MKNQRRFAPTKPGRFAPEQVTAFLRNQWPESAEYAYIMLPEAAKPEKILKEVREWPFVESAEPPRSISLP